MHEDLGLASMSQLTNYDCKPGEIWVCSACGKTSKNRYDGDTLSPSWDTSCFLNAVLCVEGSVVRREDNRVNRADPVEQEDNGK